MNVAVVLNSCDHTEVTLDTIDAIQKYVGNQILLVTDGAFWGWAKKLDAPVHKLEGFHHRCPKSPYRNVTLGLYHALQKWPDADWYCYTEYDCLFTSEAFKEDLKQAESDGVWCLGNDARTGDYKLPLLEYIVKMKFEESKYLLGCCVFYSGTFLRKLLDSDFFDRFLYYTNDFSRGFFPGYEEQGGYDFAEHLYPTLANSMGGKVRGMAYWQESPGIWRGSFRKYPLRWMPDLNPHSEHFPEATIQHPLKEYNHPIRQLERMRR